MYDVANYEVGVRCWLPDDREGWVGVEITNKAVEGEKILLTLRGAGEDDITLELTEKNAPPLRNPPVLESTEDLTTLSYLNEPAVLHAIKMRYSQLSIYTFSGIVLIATNPFSRVDNLYTPEVIQAYSGRQRGELEPHLFSIAEDAYRCMIREQRNQTIVVSGESGAGKTVSAKYIMRYFATVEDSESAKSGHGEGISNELSPVEREILATNPIMEAFGNAKTTRNDNSSRFGKYLEIRFNERQEIVGAVIRTYLLERSRIVFHAPSERNYHIFYQLVKGASDEQRAALGLASVADFAYLSQGDPDVANVDDAAELAQTREALGVVGIDDTQQEAIFVVLAALLHLGNVTIKAGRNNASVSSDDEALVKACELLGINPSELARWLTKKQSVVRNDKIVSDLDYKTALSVRDSVAKHVYSTLFDWLVSAVNLKLKGGAATTFIGVLDIYGFEHFKKNSFEQFCINYANEKLQQEFNQHVFKLEQEEYKNEEINWDYIDFSDNQPCITLIENKLGILSLLDEESRLPAGSDDGFVQKLYSSFDNPQQPYFSKPRFGQSAFVVKHYAMEVTYETEGFIEKNRDTMPDTIVETLAKTTNPFLKEILDAKAAEQRAAEEKAEKAAEAAKAAAEASKPAGKPGPGPRGGPGRGPRKPTLGNIFKTSLIELMDTINDTNVHYIRCIKPNEEKEAWKFDGPMVLSQLRACGVLETIRISSAGFPSRWAYEDFAERYEMLLKGSQRNSDDPRALCQSIIAAAIDDKDKYQLGKTKLFFRAGQLAHLEKLRSSRLKWGATKIQSVLKMHVQRRRYAETLQSINALQSVARASLARRQVQEIRQQAAASRLQAQFRGNKQRTAFKGTMASVLALQASVRGYKARQQLLSARKDDFVKEIQAISRAYLLRRSHQKDVGGIVLAQTLTRRLFARRELARLREDRNSVKHFEEAQYRLENKVVQLQNTISEQRETARNLGAEHEQLQAEHSALKDQLTARTDSHAKELAAHVATIGERDASLRDLSAEIDTHKSTIQTHKTEQTNLEAQLEAARQQNVALEARIAELRDELEVARTATAEAEAAAASAPRQVVMTGAGLHPSSGPGAVDQVYARNLGTASGNTSELQPLGDSDDSSINSEIERMLSETTGGARDELLYKLIRNLVVPSPKAAGTGENLQRKDVMFPSNMVNMMISEMWRLGYVEESEKIIGNILKLVQDTVSKHTGEKIIHVGAFWMSNVHEIFSFLCLAEMNILNNPVLRQEMTAMELAQYERLMNLAKRDTEAVIFNIYHIWMKEIKKLFDKMIVPAVVDEQSIPGFQVEVQPRFLPKMFQSGSDYKMNDLLLLLTKVHTSMQAFYLEESYMRQPIIELLHMVGAKAFNDMIMRKNFLSWKRAVQINYNVTRIEEWCKGHSMPEGALPLDRLMQSAKLLQLKKNLDTDVNIIYDICWALNPAQIQRLIVNYHVSDYESPVPESVLKVVAQRVKEDKTSSTQLLQDFRPIGDSGPFEMAMARQLKKIEPYIPADLDVPKLRELTELTARASRMTGGGSETLEIEN